ncbi:MAG: NAD(P)(+) transhydrogenase (Re/Si-specific) subunit alpha, partial [Oscillochloris sp.]|nr:NAD(P)(+) transhydrogenase (Re/Si-specific) subunit alpha [Oscillochloris sp.]
MIVGILKEQFPGEQRVALVPGDLATLGKLGLETVLEAGAGERAGFLDAHYSERGARVLPDRAAVIKAADLLVQVRGAGAAPDQAAADAGLLRSGQIVVAMLEPLGDPQAVAQLAGSGVSAFALEMVPRISRAQSMDVLSSMATIAGYKAVLLAATHLPRIFPMLMTAAGTITPARVFVIGAGVAACKPLQPRNRLGARVEAYDVRPVVK